jgi:hypothetical protein
MKMTPEKIAFIEGGPGKAEKQDSTKVKTDKSSTDKAIDVQLSQGESANTLERVQTPSRRTSRTRSKYEAPDASELLDQVLVPVTIRLQHRTAQALKRAYLEQKLKHLKPDTVQEIGEEALTDWLQKAGYLD